MNRLGTLPLEEANGDAGTVAVRRRWPGRCRGGEGSCASPAISFKFYFFYLEKKNMDSSEEENKFGHICKIKSDWDLTYGSNLVPRQQIRSSTRSGDL
jgi:hypothetical protein